MEAIKSFEFMESFGMIDLTQEELVDVDGGKLTEKTVYNSDGSKSVIKVDSQGVIWEWTDYPASNPTPSPTPTPTKSC